METDPQADAMERARKHLNGDDGGGEGGPLINSKARADTIRSACREIASLEAERKKIGEQIRLVKTKKIKGDLGMKLADFNAALRLYGLEDEDRDTFFDALKETFEALGAGAQLDWVDALAKSGADA